MNQLVTIVVSVIGLVGIAIGAYYTYRASVINSLVARVNALEHALDEKEKNWSDRYDKLNTQYNSVWSEMLTLRDENVNLREQLQLYIK